MSTATLVTPSTVETGTDSEGWVYCLRSGEVLGRLDGDGFLVREAFKVDSEESAEWVLSVRAETEARIVALQHRKAALIRNLDAQIKEQVGRLAFWDWKFRPSLIEWARGQLTGKCRTWQGAQGKVAFRKTQGTTQILDNAAALEFVRTWEPGLIRVVESVNLDAIEAAKVKAGEVTGEDVPLPFVKASGAGENISIETGVEIKGGRK